MMYVFDVLEFDLWESGPGWCPPVVNQFKVKQCWMNPFVYVP